MYNEEIASCITYAYYASSMYRTPLLSTIYHVPSLMSIGTRIFTKVMCTHGGMKLSSEILGYPSASSTLVRAMVGFMRNLCADDLRKETLGK